MRGGWRRKLRQAGADAVAVYGGDGTVAEVAAGLFNSEIPLVVPPGGTTNATGRSLGIPIDPAEAAQLLADPHAQVRAMDMLQVGEVYFFGVVAMGIPGEVAALADREAKDRFGNLAYALSAIRATVRAPNSDYAITLDGQEIHSHGVMCVILNQSAGLMRLAAVDAPMACWMWPSSAMKACSPSRRQPVIALVHNENLMPVEHGRVRSHRCQPAHRLCRPMVKFCRPAASRCEFCPEPCGL